MSDKYVFVYKDAQGCWGIATNPIFIAKHKRCRAIEKELIDKTFGNSIIMKRKLNDFKHDSKTILFIRQTDLKEI